MEQSVDGSVGYRDELSVSCEADGRGRINELTDVTENILERQGEDDRVDVSRGQGRVESEDISSITCDMGGSHGGSS